MESLEADGAVRRTAGRVHEASRRPRTPRSGLRSWQRITYTGARQVTPRKLTDDLLPRSWDGPQEYR